MVDQPGYNTPFSQWSGNTDYHALEFIVRMLMGQAATATPVLVKAVNIAEDGAGTVDVQPMVAQVNGDGETTEHGTVFGLPYFRLQGGLNAVRVDPAVGDIGLAVIASRDITVVKSTAAPGPPGSFRQFDLADGIYMGGLLNAAPTQVVYFAPDGIEVTSPTRVTVTSPAIALDGDVTVSGTLDVDGAVTGGDTAVFADTVIGDGVNLSTHVHSGVTTGGGTSGPPA